jgi:hypothetical protein
MVEQALHDPFRHQLVSPPSKVRVSVKTEWVVGRIRELPEGVDVVEITPRRE